MSVQIIDAGLSFTGLSARSKTTYLILHHSASENTTVETIHGWHKANGWAGIGYNFYIRQDGSVYQGRGWAYTGAHTEGYNAVSIGICFGGNFETTSVSMSDAQYRAGAALITEALERYPAIETVTGHSSLGSTACPGRYFPLAQIITDGKAGSAAGCESDSSGCPYGTSTDTVQNGSQGISVSRCQWYLNEVGGAGLTIDGICGSKTVAAIKAFQASAGLSADGICGPNTWAALEAAARTNQNEVFAAIETLTASGIITTPAYWRENYAKIPYLDILLIKLAGAAFNSQEAGAFQTLGAAVTALQAAGIMNTPDYWLENAAKLGYVDTLLIKAANRL